MKNQTERSLRRRFAALDDEDREALLETLDTVIAMLSNGEGCAVVAVNTTGKGVMEVAIMGNMDIAPDMFEALGQMHQQLHLKPQGLNVQ